MKHHTFKSESALRDFLPKLVSQSCWFEVTPEPDDEWTVSVKDDVAHVTFSDATRSAEPITPSRNDSAETYDRIIWVKA